MERLLTKFGFDPQAEAKKLQGLSQKEQIDYLTRELESHELHVVRNHVVSLPYSYWLSDKGEIFTNREKTISLELDERERGGYFKIGIPKALKLARDNPYQLVFLYSPIGPASFDNPPDPDYARPYQIGQLYLIYYDGEKINNIAVSLDRQGEVVWLKEIFGEDYLSFTDGGQDEIEKIIRFIINPQLTNMGIEDFLSHNWQNPDLIVFHNNSFGRRKDFSVREVMEELRKSITGRLKAQINNELIAIKTVRNGGGYIKAEDVAVAYQTMMNKVMERTKVNELTLGGGCGGSVVTASDLLSLSPVEKLMEVSNLSSSYRRQLLTLDKEESDRYEDYECPNCHTKIKGELKGRPETWTPACPHCGYKFNCKSKHTQA